MTQQGTNKITHLGKMHLHNRHVHLILRELAKDQFVWFIKEESGNEQKTEIAAPTASLAIREARIQWADSGFRTLHCGFRYMLPERDEHGMNALYHEMVSSLSSTSGVYFDNERGYNCFVQNASQEAIDFWQSTLQRK